MSTENTGAAPDSTSSQISPETASEATEATTEESSIEGAPEAVVQEAAAVIADPTASKAEKVAAKKMLKSLKIKVDGKEYDEALPFEMEDNPKQVEWMTKQLQLSKVSQKRMQEKADIENEVRQFLDNLRNNPEEVLNDPRIGVDLKKFAVKIIEQELENEKKSPEQLELEKTKRELKQMKEAHDRAQAAALEQKRLQSESEAYTRYEMQIDQAFTKNPDVPKTPANIERLSQYMMLGIKNGLDVSPDDVIHIVRDEADNEFKQRLTSSSDDDLEKMIGKERLTALQKKKLAKAKEAQAKAVAASKIPDTGTKSPKTEETKEIKTIRSFFGV